MRLSSTLLYDSIVMLDWIAERAIHRKDHIGFFASYISIEPKAILEWLTKNGLIVLENDFYILSKEAKEYFGNKEMVISDHLKKRHIIQHYIIHSNPSWSGRIIYGRKELYDFLSKDEQRVFIEAKLMNEYDSSTISWWDDVANAVRQRFGLSLTTEGRTGELLSVEYESKRTGKPPVLVSLDSNLLGYDLESTVDATQKETLLVEVKTTVLEEEEAVIYISENEWNIASNNQHYIFHIWSIGHGPSKLLTLEPREIAPHIPVNNGQGTWATVKVKIDSLVNGKSWKEFNNVR